MSPDLSVRSVLARLTRRALPWALALAVATCTDDSTGPSKGGVGYFSFRPVYAGIASSLSQFGIVADSVHVVLTRPIDEVVLDTTVFFPPDSLELRLALPVGLTQSPEILTAMIEITAGGVVLFVDTLEVEVVDGPPGTSPTATATLDYVGPGNDIAAVTVLPADTTIFFGDTLFYTSTAVDSSDNPVLSYYIAWKTSDTAVAKVNAQGRLIAPNVRGTVRVVGHTPTGIADTADITFAPVPSQILADSGAAQAGAVGDSLAQLFVAQVRAADDLPIEGIHVRFTVSAGGAVRDTLLVTDENGRVRTRGLLGTTGGAYTWTATIVGTAISTTFTGTASVGAPASIAISAGDLQVDSAGTLLPLPFAARVADAFDNPVPGVKIYWIRTVGTGSLALDSSFTDGTGIASVGYTLGAVGVDSITATIAGTSAFVAFQATAINGMPASVVKNFGDAQTDTVGRALADSLVVVVLSATSQPVVGSPVAWTVLRGGSTSADTVLTDGDGRAAVAYTLGTLPGADSVQAAAGGASAVFTATVATGAATTLTLVSGSGQVDTIGKPLPLPFLVQATDTFGNNVAGTLVIWEVAAGSGTLTADSVLTDSLGIAGTTYILGPTPGSDTISATLVCACSTVPFFVTGVNSAPAAIQIVAGDGQSAAPATTLPDSIVATVLDGVSAPIAGAEVVWTVIRGGSVDTDTVYSDALGHVAALYTTGTLAGVDSIEARATVGGASTIFTAMVTAGAPVSIGMVSGDGQSDTVGNAIPLPFVVEVQDAFNNPVAGTEVAFERIAGSGTLFGDTILTDSVGRAAMGYLFGLVPGADSIRVTLVATGGIVDFTATALAATPATITVISGDGQTAAVTDPYTDSLVVEVLDGGGTPIFGHTVVWTMATGGTLSTDTTITDSTGRAWVHVTAGDSAGTFAAEATAAGLGLPATFALNVVAGAPAALMITSGDGQTDTTGVTLDAPFVVTVTDAFGNPVLGAAVHWQVQAGSGNADDDTTFTNIAGQTQVNYTLGAVPGAETVRATLVGTSAFVDFGASTISGAPAFLLTIAGDGQVDSVLSTLADSLVVELRDAANVPIPNTWLYWTTAAATLSADSTLTDANGRAAVQVTFDSIAIQTIPVVVNNVDTTIGTAFLLHATAGMPAQLTQVSGDGQSDSVNVTLPLPFTVFALDAYSNPADSALVTFTRTAGSGSVVPDTAMADSIGFASAVYTLGPTAGTDTIIAQLVGHPASVEFTATATSGAAATLAYVSGTGQSQTVGTTLAGGFQLEVRDAQSNPVPGAWVYWAVLSGGSTLPVDSSQADGLGIAQLTLTLGTLAGIDSIAVTVGGSADTLVFYAQALPDAPQDIQVSLGDLQSGTVGGFLPDPFEVAVVDQYNNPVPGVSVTFGVLEGVGLSFSTTEAVTDGFGFARSDTVYLDGPAGSYTGIAVFGTDTAFFSTVILPIGASKQWTGAVSIDWGDPANWSPAGIPSAADNVYIPAGATNQPYLDVSRATGGLQVESGADLNVQGNILTLNGDLVVEGTISRSSGHVILAATTGTARGNLGAIEVTGDITLNGPSSTTDNTIITSGALVVGGQTLDITGNLEVGGTGAFVMSHPADSVTITGPAAFYGSTAIGNLTDGILILLGDFGEASASATFRATSAHRTRFAGSVPQNVSMSGALLGGDQFYDVEFENPAGVVMSTSIAVAGNAFVNAPATSSVSGAVIAGALVDPGTPDWNVLQTEFASTAAIGADTILNDVLISGDITLQQSLVVTGAFELNGTAFDLNTHRLDVGGLLAVTAGDFEMNNATDTLFAHADVSWAGSSTTGLLSAGNLFIAGNFSETSASSTFRASGTHTTTFAGATAQTISFNGPALGGDQFQHLVFDNVNGFTLNSDIAVGGGTTVAAGIVDGTSDAATLAGDLVGATPSTWFVLLTRFDGSPTAIPDTFSYGVEVTGSVVLPHSVVVQGDLTLPSGSLNLGSYRLEAGSLTVSGTGALLMQNPADTLDVLGATSWGGSTAEGNLGAGTAIFRGNFAETSASPTYRAIGGHTTIFAGSSGTQTVAFTDPVPGGDEFREVVFANTSGVDLTSNMVVNGTATVDVGTVTGLGRTAILYGSLIDTSNASWQVDTTELAFTPGTLPAALPGNLKVSANVDLPNQLTVGGSFVQTGGIFGLTGFSLTVTGELLLTSGAEFRMVNASDSLDVNGNATWDGSSSTGLLTDGIAVFRGDFSEVSASSTYRESGSHRTLFLGNGAQSVSFDTPALGGDQFENVTFQNPFGVTISDIAAVDVTVAGGSVSGTAVTATIGGQLVDTVNGWGPDLTRFANAVSVLPVNFSRGVEFAAGGTLAQPLEVEGMLTVSGGVLDPNQQPVLVLSGLSVWGGAAIQMQNAADSIDVTGAVVWDGSTTPGLLTAGVLVLRGNFLQTNTLGGFLPTVAHRTVFEGGATHTVEFWSPSSNGFHHVEIRGGSTLDLSSNVHVSGTLATGGADIRSTVGDQMLTVRDLDVDNVTFDSVRVVQSGPALTAFNNVTFTAQNPDLVQLWLTQGGTEAPQNFTNVQFLTQPTGGRYIALADSVADGLAFTVNMFESGPVDGTPFEFEAGGNDGTQVNWSRLVFAEDPAGGIAGSSMTAIRVALVDPADDTVTSFSELVTLTIGTNPSGGTLTGTNAVGASSGIASFEGLSIDLAGVGYDLVATAAGTSVTSAAFTISVPLPAGFDVQWLGTIDTDWGDPLNWSTGAVPDSTTNVFVSGIGINDPVVPADSFFVKRLRVAGGASLALAAGGTLVADSSIEAASDIPGGGLLVLRGTGDVSGTITAPVRVDGTYSVTGTAAIQYLDVYGDLYLAADTLNVGGAVGTYGGTGRIHSTSADALIDVAGPAYFSGGSTTGTLVAGTLRVSGDLVALGGAADAFAPGGGHLTILNGSGVQTVNFSAPDSVTGSHFDRLQVSTTGTAFMMGRYNALGDLLITSGATLADSLVAGFEAHGFTTIDAGGALDVNNFRTRGGIGVAVGATYSVATTTYYGGGAFPINPAPYDTLVLQLHGEATGDLTITGDLRIDGGTAIARFDPNGFNVAVSGSMNVDGNGALIMQDAADSLFIGGSFYTNGASTDGLLTAGWLRIGGSFRQAADGSGEAFRAGPNHTTEFYFGGPTARSIEFDSPSFGPGASTGSHFGALLLPIGTDTLIGRVPAAGKMFLAAALVQDTSFSSNALVGYDSVTISSASPSIQLRTLEAWGGLAVDVGAPFDVVYTRIMGGDGGTLPDLAYQNLQIANTSYTLGGDLTLPGDLTVGIYCSEVCTSSPGDLTVGGNTLVVGGDLGVMGLGHFMMADGDSVDVTGENVWRTEANDGDLTGGTLVVRGRFNTVGFNTFQASVGHRTVMAAPGVEDIYPTGGMRFGTLVLLDSAPRRIRSSEPVVVLDTLLLGANTAGLHDTLGFSSGSIEARGPVVTVSGSSIYMEGSVRFDHDDILLGGAYGSYLAGTTIFGGTGQTIPALSYSNIIVRGTASLAASLDIGTSQFTIDGSAGTADLDLNGQVLAVGDFTTGGDGTLTSTIVGSGLLVRGDATFNGGDETGRLTEGGITLRGFFTQDSLTSVSSYVSSGNHTTVFADSTFGGSQAVLSSMAGGESRFNTLAVYGNGVTFFGNAWIDGSINMLDPLMADSVRSSDAVRIAGTLNDPTNRWKVDTTVVVASSAVLPDTIDRHLIFDTDYTLTNLLRVGGIVQIHDTVAIGGYTLLAHNSLMVEGAGVLQMTDPTDDVQVDGFAVFNGMPTGALMQSGRLTLRGGFHVAQPGVFNATGTHKTVLDGSGSQSLTIDGSTGNGFNDLVVYVQQVSYTYPLLVHGTFSDSVTATWLSMVGAATSFDARHAELQNVQFTNTTLTIGDSSQVDSVSIYQATPEGLTQLTVRGAGRTTPLDLSRVMFFNLPTTGALLQVNDTVGSGDSLVVRMFGSTPFNGTTLTTATGLGGAQWSQLALSGGLPLTFDSLVPFGLTLVVKQPDGSNWPDVIGSVDISLVNGGSATLNGGTTATFDGQSASFFGLTLDQVVTGAYFHFQMQGSAIDSLNTAPFNVINPAPPGSIAWDGEGGDGLWSTAANWVGDLVPSPLDSVFIPGEVTVTFEAGNDTISGLLLGQGASLNLDPGQTLTVFGSLSAGTTIYGTGDLVLAGSVMPVTGTINAPTTITGSIVTVGDVTFNSDLTVDGPTAELNIGGAKVTVIGTFGTLNGGILTMDGATDTLMVNAASFDGGNTAGKLTDGTLIVMGSSFTQGGPEPESFAASGNHRTVFEDAGAISIVFFGADPTFSHFHDLQVNTPNSLSLSAGSGWVRAFGDVTLDEDGAVTGDTLQVDGTLLMGGSSTLTLGQLLLGASPVLAGTYTVGTTWYYGSGLNIPAAPQGYQTLYLDNATLLGDSMSAKLVHVTGTGYLDLNEHLLVTDTLQTSSDANVLLNSAGDSIIVNQFAQFAGASPAIPFIGGYLELRGDLDVGENYTMLIADPGHVTRFAGNAVHNTDFPGEGNFVSLGTVVIDSSTMLLDDDLRITGDLVLHNGALADSNFIRELRVDGSIQADDGPATELMLGELQLVGGLTFAADTARFDIPQIRFVGTGQSIPGAIPYQQIFVRGSAALAGDVRTGHAAVDVNGTLAIGAFTLAVDTNLWVTDSGYIVMGDPAGVIDVAGIATFQGPNSSGNFTAGAIRARHFVSSNGPTGDMTSFVQTGSHRIVPQAGDTIEMPNAGPGASTLKTLVLEDVGGPVYTSGMWLSDSLIILGAASSLVSTEFGEQVVVGSGGGSAGVVVVALGGTLDLDILATSGSLNAAGGTYDVRLTKFVGNGQTITPGLPYRDVEVQYIATLGGDVLMTGAGQTFQVGNFGDLDLGGHRLEVDSFMTSGYGLLRMDAADDTLRAEFARFGGGSTNGTLTAGEFEVGTFEQQYNLDSTSFAASGTHQTTFLNIGGFTESGRDITFQSPSDTLSHFNRVRFLGTEGNRLWSDIYALDTMYVNNSLGTFVSPTVVALGPAIIDSAADFGVDTLRMADTLIIHPSATTDLGNWVFGPTAKTPPAWANYSEVFLEGTLTLQDSLHFPGGVTVREGAVLTLNGNNFTTEYGFTLLDSARLVMTAGDTLFTGHANFGAGPTGTDLAGGLIRMSGQFWQMPTGDPASFSPTGTAVEFAVGSSQAIQFANPGSSYFRDLRIVGGTSMSVNTPMVVQGDVDIDGTSGIYDWSNGDINFFGKVTVAAGGSLSDGDAVTSLVFHDSLSVHPAATYSVFNTVFEGTDGIPNVNYTHIYLRKGVHLTLTHPLVVFGGLNLQNGSPFPDPADTIYVRLNGFKVNAFGLSLDGYAKITMDGVGDTLEIGSNATFNGVSLDSSMTAGVLRVGGYLQQLATYSSRSFAPLGTRTEFYGGGAHNVNFATPGVTLSHLEDLAVVDAGSSLSFSTIASVLGDVTVDTGSTLTAGGDAANVYFFGKVTALGSGAITNPFLSLFTFHDTLAVATPANYSVVNTAFREIDIIPNLPYQFLYLWDGAHAVLTNDITTTSSLSVDAPTGSASLTLNGRTVTVGGQFTLNGNTTLVMTNPADNLSVAQDANFGGGDEAGLLTAGTIEIGGSFSQTSAYSDRSFRSTGTLVRFTDAGFQQVTFATPDSSWFADVSDSASGTPVLNLDINGRMKATGTVGSYSTVITGDTLEAGVLSKGAGFGDVSLLRLNVGSINGSFGTYGVGTTQFLGVGTIPNFTYDTLIVSGNDTIAGYSVAANHVSVDGYLEVGDGGVLASSGDLIVGGASGYLAILKGAVSTGNDFITTANGSFEMDSAEAGLIIDGDAVITGGSTIALLKMGVMEIRGDFTQGGDPFSFVANGAHTTRFSGGGEHELTIANPVQTEFGELSLFSGGPDADTLLLTSGQVRAVRLAANGDGRIRSNGTALQVAELNVDGLFVQHTPIVQSTTAQVPLAFDNVTFSGFTATEVQLSIDHPGFGGTFDFSGVTFDGVADGVTGFWVRATDQDGVVPNLTINFLFTPYEVTGPGMTQTINGAVVEYPPPG